MNDAAARWIARLPWRWGAGGFVIGALWVALTVGLTGGWAAPMIRSWATIRVFLVIVLPLAILGGIWGLSERRKLQRAASDAAKLALAVRGFLARQVGKAMICGLVFAIFIYGSGLAHATRPWTSVGDLIDDASKLLGAVLGAVPIGIGVGLVAGRALRKRLAGGQVAQIF